MKTLNVLVHLTLAVQVPDNADVSTAVVRASSAVGCISTESNGVTISEMSASHSPPFEAPGVFGSEGPTPREMWQELLDRLPPKREKWEGGDGGDA